MRTLKISSTETLEYPNMLAFMYSPQIVRYTNTSSATPTAASLWMDVTVATDSGRRYTERRRIGWSQGQPQKVEMDISGIMQALATDPDTLLETLDYTGPSVKFYEDFTVKLKRVTSSTNLAVFFVRARYGALDAGEVFRHSAPRRVWLHWPCTVDLMPRQGAVAAANGYFFGYTDYYPGVPGECDLVQHLLQQEEGNTDRADLLSGKPLDLGVSEYIVEDGTLSEDTNGVPWKVEVDMTPRRDDLFMLRWLDRTGAVRYWLFRGGNYKFTTAVSENWSRHYGADPSIPVGGEYRNALKANFTAGRTMTLGTRVNPDEFDMLCGLAASPCVSLLVGGTRTSPKWMRVVVAAGAYTRSRRFATPKLTDFEITISLPGLNTVTL